MLAAFMTQKMAAVGGVTIALMLAVDLVRHLRGRGGDAPSRAEAPAERAAAISFVVSPFAFALAAGAILVALLGLAATLGMLREGFEITILQAIEHEFVYPRRLVSDYLDPFMAATWYTSVPILCFAFVYLIDRSAGFWRCAVLVAFAGGAMVKAQYPYNYIYLSFLIGLCALRGYSSVVRALPLNGALGRARPLLYLVPLLVLPDQLGFVSNRTSNAHQLAILDKIQRYSSEGDKVIDNSGGALFRRSASYYYHHGKFHRELFKKYFRKDMIGDYRSSAAPFWIYDSRAEELPRPPRRFLRRHYVRVDGNLHALGLVIKPNRSEYEKEIKFQILRAGHYHLFSSNPRRRGGTESRPTHIWIDGVRVTLDGGIDLEPGTHSASLGKESRQFVLSILPHEAFASDAPGPRPRGPTFSMMFEYDEPDYEGILGN
jgi:hypothetical protein